MTEVIEGDAVEVDVPPNPRQEIAVRPPAELTVTPQVEAADLVKRLEVIKQAMETAMVKDVDYGIIPGTTKPALFKPGSEKLAVLFQLDVQIENRKTWGENGHLTVESIAQVFHAPTGTRLGSGEGMCSTYEKKYRYRGGTRQCPVCGQATIFRSKFPPREGDYTGATPQDTPGWFCWTSKGGCGQNFAYETPEIKDAGERVENPDMADTWNTVVKMAAKRARVDGILNVTGASALFTQDVEDQADGDGAAAENGQQTTAAVTSTTTTTQQADESAPIKWVDGAPDNPATKLYNLGGYDGHNVDKIKPMLPNLTDDQLAYVEHYEKHAIPPGLDAPKNRKGVLDAIAQEHRERARKKLAEEAARNGGEPGPALQADTQPPLDKAPFEWTPLDERSPTKEEYDAAKILAANGSEAEKEISTILITAYEEAQKKQPAFVPPATARPALMRVVKGIGLLSEQGVESWNEDKVIVSAQQSFQRPQLTSLEELTDAELDSIFSFMPDETKADVLQEIPT